MSKVGFLLSSIIAVLVQVILFMGLAITGILDPFLPLERLFTENALQIPTGFDNLGFFFNLWNYLTFSLTSSNVLFSQPFDLSYLLFLVVFLLSVFIGALFAKNSGQAILGAIGMIILQMIVAVIAAQLIAPLIQIASLPPSEQDLVKSLGTNLPKITLSPLVGSLLVPFVINVVLAVVIAILGAKFSFRKSKK